MIYDKRKYIYNMSRYYSNTIAKDYIVTRSSCKARAHVRDLILTASTTSTYYFPIVCIIYNVL